MRSAKAQDEFWRDKQKAAGGDLGKLDKLLEREAAAGGGAAGAGPADARKVSLSIS